MSSGSFLKFNLNNEKRYRFFFRRRSSQQELRDLFFLSHDDAVEAGAVGLALLVLRSALWRSGILVITIPGAKELSYSQR
jgi:hypothetical protein